jgi:O-antigen ligase
VPQGEGHFRERGASPLAADTRTGAIETVGVRSVGLRTVGPMDLSALGTWALAGGLILFLGFDGGGYDLIVRNQVGIVLWWIVLVGAAFGVLPATRLTRVAWTALALFAGFVAWNALATTWSLSSERSLRELSRVACYLAVLLLAVSIHRDRDRAVRHTIEGVAGAVAIIATFAVVSRLIPGSFPASHVTGTFLAGARGRLSWPLNYWNGLAALVALGLPLLLSIASSARALWAQAAAAAALPVLGLCGFLTFSRGGAIAAAVALVAFLALAPHRLAKLPTMLVAAAGAAILMAAVSHHTALDQGLTNHAADVQGKQVLAALVLVCAAVALAQIGIGLAARHGTLPRSLRVSRGTARRLLAGGIAAALVAAIAAGAPSRLSHAWDNFKHQTTASQFTQGRFGSTAGNGRYDMWRVALQTTSGKRLGGSGPGTFQLLWQPRAAFNSYVINAHSLYVETLAELGVVGLALLVAFLATPVVAAVGLVRRSGSEARTFAAGAAAGMLAFLVSALADWVWQLPVLPAAFLLLAAAVMAPARAAVRGSALASQEIRTDGEHRPPVVLRAGFVVAALACLVATAVPLATDSAVRKSQAAVTAGNDLLALSDARSATRIEPGAASAQLQVALVLELGHDIPGALQAASRATRDEPDNWSTWLVLSRLEAEAGRARASVASYGRARSLNPRSPLFRPAATGSP